LQSSTAQIHTLTIWGSSRAVSTIDIHCLQASDGHLKRSVLGMVLKTVSADRLGRKTSYGVHRAFKSLESLVPDGARPAPLIWPSDESGASVSKSPF
jgi:hypothetical protein